MRQEIAHIVLCEQVARQTRIGFQFASEAVDRCLEQMVLFNVRFSPDVLEQRVLSDDMPGTVC